MDNRDKRQYRGAATEFRAAGENGKRYIEGYFAVFDSVYELWPGATESVGSTAFDGTLGNDIRALIDHRTELVLGRSANHVHTLELRVDSHGLWGRIEINEDDVDATNLYARVMRGDVNQCSFGFEILDESVEYRDDGSVHWTLNKVALYEVSVCTFPAYVETSVGARKAEYDNIKKRRMDVWRDELKRRIRGHESQTGTHN